MAERWSIKEDYIVCKFSYERNWEYISAQELHCLMLELKEAGFNSRSKTAVNKRVRDYQLLFSGKYSPYATEQVRTIHQSFLARVNDTALNNSIKFYIVKTYDPDAIPSKDAHDATDGLYSERNDLTHYEHVFDFNLTFPMVLQKYIDKKGFKKHKEIYDRIYMKENTFSAILRGKYPVVKKENVLRLCVGLKLNIEEAEELMESAGYVFSRGLKTDVIVKAYLVHKCYNPVLINIELDEYRQPQLFIEQ